MKKFAITRMGAHIKVKSMQRSLDFYQKLGFEPIFAYGFSEFIEKFTCPTASEKYCGVTFGIGNALFEIADGHIAVKPEVFLEEVKSSKISLMFDVDSIENIFQCANENDLTIAVPIREFPWGTKELVLRDPDGVILVFREILANSAEKSL